MLMMWICLLQREYLFAHLCWRSSFVQQQTFLSKCLTLMHCGLNAGAPHLNMRASLDWRSGQYFRVPWNCYQNSSRYSTERVSKLQGICVGLPVFCIFGRERVCSVFLVAKLRYALQVLYCAQGHIQRFHRVLATIVWGSSWLPMRRVNLLLPV